MLRVSKFAIRVIAVAGLIAAAAPALAGERAGAVQLAFHANSQTATLPVGTIRLRVIERVGGPVIKDPIKWRVMTYGRDAQGRRHLIAEVTAAAPELALPAAWYIVHAQLRDQEIVHPVEVTAGRTYKYTLVKK
ncbi:MAG: hypothetical protein IIC53_08875 [Proteobacteria bacterium]|nr:hypothetical protein [Pseudomonadota bacterium]MCH8999914.1 hypothetical protein [Pseudomonadota bacterium]